jgi:hypothetical protein
MTRFLAFIPVLGGCLLWMSGTTGLWAEAPATPVIPAVTNSSDRKVGGFAVVSTTKREVKSAAAFAVKAQQTALRKEAVGLDDPKAKPQPIPRLALVRIVAAEHQVVAGMNYRLQLRVTLDGEEKTADALVWWQAWRKPEPYQLTSWTWK